MGALLGAGQRRFARGSPVGLRVAGALLVFVVAGVAGLTGWLVSGFAATLGLFGPLVEALALKLMFAVRDLTRATLRVAGDLESGDLASARANVGTDLVSRPTSGLDSSGIASAAIESAAENLTDSVLAPLLFYAAFGLAGAAVYRAVNTADAMIGYRTGMLEDFGKVTARLDDVLNLIPARLAGLLVVVAAAMTGARPTGAWKTMWRDHARTASPNAGWTIAAMAGALGVTLEKSDHYRLGDGRTPTAHEVRRSVRVMVAASALGGGLVALTIGIFH